MFPNPVGKDFQNQNKGPGYSDGGKDSSSPGVAVIHWVCLNGQVSMCSSYLLCSWPAPEAQVLLYSSVTSSSATFGTATTNTRLINLDGLVKLDPAKDVS